MEHHDNEICYIHAGSPGNGETVTTTCYVGGPTYARSVYIYLPGDNRVLTLCEVEIYEFTGIIQKHYIIHRMFTLSLF